MCDICEAELGIRLMAERKQVWRDLPDIMGVDVAEWEDDDGGTGTE